MFEKEMKRIISTIVGIAATVLLVALIVGASHWYGYSRYGAYYYRPYGVPLYSAYYESPYFNQPYYASSYQYQPSYSYPYYYSPLSSRYMYRYGAYQQPTTVYPAYSTSPTVSYPVSADVRGREGQLCGMISGSQHGCEYGLTCDYMRAEQPGIGLCSR